jgi:hypothetical protein
MFDPPRGLSYVSCNWKGEFRQHGWPTKTRQFLALMAEANTQFVGLLAQSTNSAFHLLGNFYNRRFCL